MTGGLHFLVTEGTLHGGGVHCDICDITELYIIVLICAYLLEAGQGSCYLVLFCMDFYYLVLCQGHVRGFP